MSTHTDLDDDVPVFNAQEVSSSWACLIDDAKTATTSERNMTLLQGIRTYPKAVFWSMLISTCIIMEGYDISLISNFFAFDTFNRKYGVKGDDGTYQVPARVR